MKPSQQLAIKTVAVEIKVVQVDGHKMTKATFRQIQTDRYRNEDSLFGWVDDEYYWLLFAREGRLFRYRLDEPKIIREVLKRYDQIYIAT